MSSVENIKLKQEPQKRRGWIAKSKKEKLLNAMERQRIKRALETPKQREWRLRRDRERHRLIRSKEVESKKHREERLRKNREQKRRQRRNESEKKRLERLKRDRERKRNVQALKGKRRSNAKSNISRTSKRLAESDDDDLSDENSSDEDSSDENNFDENSSDGNEKCSDENNCSGEESDSSGDECKTRTIVTRSRASKEKREKHVQLLRRSRASKEKRTDDVDSNDDPVLRHFTELYELVRSSDVPGTYKECLSKVISLLTCQRSFVCEMCRLKQLEFLKETFELTESHFDAFRENYIEIDESLASITTCTYCYFHLYQGEIPQRVNDSEQSDDSEYRIRELFQSFVTDVTPSTFLSMAPEQRMGIATSVYLLAENLGVLVKDLSDVLWHYIFHRTAANEGIPQSIRKENNSFHNSEYSVTVFEKIFWQHWERTQMQGISTKPTNEFADELNLFSDEEPISDVESYYSVLESTNYETCDASLNDSGEFENIIWM